MFGTIFTKLVKIFAKVTGQFLYTQSSYDAAADIPFKVIIFSLYFRDLLFEEYLISNYYKLIII